MVQMLRDLVAEFSHGTRITYVDAGVPDGSTVILLHGTPACRMEAAGPLDTAAHSRWWAPPEADGMPAFRALVGSMAWRFRRHPDGWRGLLPGLPPADERTLALEDAQSVMRSMLAEALRQGPRGVARMLADDTPGARLHLLEGKGHFSLIIDEAARYLGSARAVAG